MRGGRYEVADRFRFGDPALSTVKKYASSKWWIMLRDESLDVTIIVTPYIEESGLKWNIDQLSKQLIGDGHDVTILTFDGESREEFSEDGKRIVRAKAPAYFPPVSTHLNYKVVKEMTKLEAETDIFHVFNTSCTPGAGLYKLLGGDTKVVSTLNNWGLICPCYNLDVGDPLTNHNFVERAYCAFKAARNPIEKVASLPYSQYFYLEKKWPGRHVDRYTAISQYVKDVYVNNGYPESMEITSNHLDHEFLENTGSAGSSRTDDRFSILYVGRFTKSKGVNLLLDAIANVDFDVRLYAAGWGPLEDEIRASENVEFLGFVGRSELPKYYENSDVFVHPATRPEPFGKTILEALSCDLPVLCSDVGAPPRIAGAASVQFESGSEADLTRKLEYLCSNRDKLAELSNECENEREAYDFERTYSKITRIYSSVVDA